MTRLSLFTILFLSATLCFQNCARSGGAPADGTGVIPAENNGGQQANDGQSLTLTSPYYSLNHNSSVQITAAGGSAPYTFSIVNGGGSIDASSGLYTSPTSDDSVTILAQDSTGRTGYLVLTITSSSSQGSVTCDDIIPVAASQACYGAKDSTCSVVVSYATKVPSYCRVETFRITARYFSGTSGSCSIDTAMSFTQSGSQTTGQSSGKVATLKVDVDLEGKKATLTSSAYGWGSCGGSPCNACVSDVRYELVLAPQ